MFYVIYGRKLYLIPLPPSNFLACSRLPDSWKRRLVKSGAKKMKNILISLLSAAANYLYACNRL